MNIEIKPLSAELLQDYLYFFDNMEFTENPGWKKCYCYSPHFTGTSEEWNEEGRNRNKVIELIEKNHLRGYLAFENDKPVGWVNVNNKNNFEALKLEDEIWNEDDDSIICSIVCFVISPQYRRKGIATGFLKRIIEDYSKEGYDYIEAYPAKNEISNERNYHGPISLYLNNGFRTDEEFDDYLKVKLEL